MLKSYPSSGGHIVQQPQLHHHAKLKGKAPLMLQAQSSNESSKPSQSSIDTKVQDLPQKSEVQTQPAQIENNSREPQSSSAKAEDKISKRRKNLENKFKYESTDSVATFLSRRFGIWGGLAWVGVLAAGVIGEQVKTRLELRQEANDTKDVNGQLVELDSGVSYVDSKIGGGAAVAPGLLLVMHFRAYADDVVYEDTYARGKPVVYFYGRAGSLAGLSSGAVIGIQGMKAGGKRTVFVPPELGYGEKGVVLRPTLHVPEKQGVVPPNANLRYEIEMVRISPPPS